MGFTNLFFMIILIIFKRIKGNERIAPENGYIYDRPKNHENNDENDEKMNDSKSIQNHFEDVPVSPGHQKNIKNNQFRSPDAPEKNQKNHPKTHQFDGVWDPNFSNFPCWRMCCLRQPLGRYFK